MSGETRPNDQKLRDAALALYMAGRWSLPIGHGWPTPGEQMKLWEDLRDALGLPVGTATKLGVGA